jgi:hypothetical protein
MRVVYGCLIWAATSVALVAGGVPHSHLAVVVLAYAGFLPLLVRWLRKSREPGAAAIAVPRVSLRAFIACALVMAVVVLAIAHFWDRGILWGDEDCYRQQARIFETGHPWIAAPAPTSADPLQSAHELRFTHHIVHDGHWFTKYPPAWPVVLAAGDVVHLRWIVNPLLAVLALWIVFLLGKRELGLRDPRLPLVMLLVSPFFFMTAASQMSHMLGLVCCAGATLCFLDAMRTGGLLGIAGALAMIGVCAFVRPFTAFCTAIALAPFAIPAFIVRGKQTVRIIGLALGFGGLTVAAMALYNHFYTGHYGQSLYALYEGGGKLSDALTLSPHVILDNVKNSLRWSLQDTAIFTWPFLFPLAGYALWADRERRYQHTVVLVLFIALGLGNLINSEGSSSRFGDRYLFEGIAGPVLLAARGVELLVERWRVPTRVARAVLVTLTASGLALAVPPVAPTLAEIRPYTQVHAAVDALPDDGALVFFPITDAFTGDRFDINATDFAHAPHMFLVDPGPDRRAVVAAAEHRARWIVLGYDDVRGEPAVLASGLSAAPSAR